LFFFTNKMAQDNVSWLRQLPYYSVPISEFQNDFGFSIITKADFINNDFLNEVKNLYHSDLFQHLNFDYFTPDTFNDKFSKNECNIKLSLLHMNIRSLNKNNEEFCQFLNSLNCEFDVIVLSEVWSYNITMFSNLLPGYDFYYDLPLSSDVGGVGMYINTNLTHCVANKYQIVNSADCPIENLWIEITKGTKKYIVGGIYRHPGYKVDSFLTKFECTLTQILNCKLPCLIAGDFNIDLKKFQYHQDTKEYFDSLVVNNFSPVIVMPTRITDTSATLIDHIYYSDGTKCRDNSIITAGNLWCDISDHLPNFVFLQDSFKKKHDFTTLPLVRLHTSHNIEKFVKSVSDINWSELYNIENPNEAYNFFNMKISNAYDSSFKLVRLSRKRSRDKMWVTAGIKKSSNHKNKLYKKWLSTHSIRDEYKYKNYLKIFKTVTQVAQTAFYKEKFDTRINTTKQLWSNLNQVCSLCKVKTHTNIDSLIYNNNHLTETSDICSALNNYFL